jgi:RNA polymerase sigma-70 factor (ECF subfamily)
VPLDGILLKQENYEQLLEERLIVLYTNIRNLGDIDRGIIFLFLEGKKHEEIAAITGITTSNVGTRMARIKEKLRTHIKN